MKKKVSLKVKKVLWTTDFSKESKFCLPYIYTLSQKLKTKNHAVYVLPKLSDWIYENEFFGNSEFFKSIERTRIKSYSKIETIGKKTNISFKIDALEGKPSEEIIKYAIKNEIDMIFIGRKGVTGIEELLIGSTTSRLIRASDIPVFVAPKNRKDVEIKKILSPIDFNELSFIELKYSISLAKQLNAKLFVTHISEFFNFNVPVFERDKLINKINGKISDVAKEMNYGIEKFIYDIGDSSKKIKEISEKNKMDLVVMASHQRKGIEKFFLGSTTEKVLMVSNIPVLVLPPSKYDLS